MILNLFNILIIFNKDEIFKYNYFKIFILIKDFVIYFILNITKIIDKNLFNILFEDLRLIYLLI